LYVSLLYLSAIIFFFEAFFTSLVLLLFYYLKLVRLNNFNSKEKQKGRGGKWLRPIIEGHALNAQVNFLWQDAWCGEVLQD